LRSFSGTLLLGGEFAEHGLQELLRLLTGNLTSEQIVDELPEDSRQDALKFLETLTTKEFVVDAHEAPREGPEGGALAIDGHDVGYWETYAPSAETARKRLDAARIVISYLGEMGPAVGRALASGGIGSLVLVDAQPSGRPAQAVAAELAQKHGTKALVVPPRSIAEHLQTASLAIACSDNASLIGHDQINQLAIDHDVRWISARIDRSTGFLGPFVVPRQTACFRCYELRSRANAEYPEDHEALYAHWKRSSEIPSDWPSLGPFAQILGNILATDVLRVVATGATSSAHGRVISVDLHTFDVKKHNVLKLPRCPACSRLCDAPMTRIWDTRALGS
jgi:bacteriocin biosynthesis cyclodehydratase domain-containing protein